MADEPPQQSRGLPAERAEGQPDLHDDRSSIGLAAALEYRSHSGPLPPVEDFRGYNTVVPGAAERILAMAEREQQHRHRVERADAYGERLHIVTGQVFGLVVALAFGWWSYDLIRSGQALAGTILGGLDLVALVGLFVSSRDRNAGGGE